MYELYVNSKNQNKRYNITKIVESVNTSFHRIGTASKMEFPVLKDNIVIYHEGDCVEFYDDGEPAFKGYVFTKTINEKNEIKTVIYDQLRYLKAKQSYAFKGESLKQIITIIANQFKLQVGEIEDIPYTTPYIYHEDESLFDIITYHINQAKLQLGTEINFFDNFGKLTVKRADNMISKYKIGIGSFASGYNYKTDIDSNTYNFIKLVQPNKSTGKADLYLAESEENIKRWGVLQYYEVMNENLNAAQIKEYLKLLFHYSNKVFRSLKLEAVGIPGLRAGNTIYIDIPTIGDISINKALLIDSVTHKYKNSDHTMSLEMVVR